MLDRWGPVPLYRQIADMIRARIEERELRPGDLVPSEARLMADHKVARTTARRAIRDLRERGLVYTIQGEGTFVGPSDVIRAPRRTPVYREIATEIAELIRSGDLRPGDPIPSETALMRRHRRAKMTVRQAVLHLCEAGWTFTVPNRGTFVSPRDTWPP
ncbi:winged helix-turn-helix transcriptional regulator [Streptosporangiaceae bacterium NEAU-GS5]|nr:winged helix-turn-helix transcriptional regulator [Streptosporangiaceae bacterium NEAU-GS5]